MNALELLLANSMVHRVGWVLVQFFWQGSLICAIYAIVRSLTLASSTAQKRYVVACSALVLMSAAPVLTFVSATRKLPSPLSSWPLSSPESWERALPFMALLWCTGALTLSIRLIGSWRFTLRLKREGVRAAPAEWLALLNRLVDRFGISKPVQILISSFVEVPTIVGWMRPVVLFPVGALAGLSPAYIEALLSHEIAHIRRWDYLVNSLQSVVETLLFYHPGVWWISEEIRAERESCCDDLAVAINGDLLTYAGALAEIESLRPAHTQTTLLASGGSLLHRIQRLIGQTPSRWHALPGPGTLLLIALLWVVGLGTATAHTSPTLPPPALPTVEMPEPAGSTSLAALLLAPAGPPAPSQGPPNGQKQTIRLSGRTVDPSNKPVPQATVVLATDGRMTSRTTDDAGAFLFEDIAPGQYRLIARKSDFLTQRYGAVSSAAPGTVLNLSAGMEIKDLVMKMAPQAVIAGKIADQDSNPIPLAEVQLMRYAYVDGQRRLREAGSVTANDRGDYRFANLEAGRYYLGARDKSENTAASKTNAGTFYASTLDPANASPIEVNAGSQLAGIDIRLRREEVFSVKGHVEPGSTVTLIPQGADEIARSTSTNIRTATVQSNGQFELRGVLPGRYILWALQGRFMGKAEVAVTSSNIEDLHVSLLPMGPIEGRVTLEDGDLQSVMRPQSSGQSVPTLTVQLDPAEALPFHGIGLVQGDGNFLIPLAGAARYRWDVFGIPEGMYVKAVKFEGQDTTRTLVDNTAGNGGILDIVLSSKAARITGVVRDAKNESASGVVVTLWPRVSNSENPSKVRTTYANQDGAFTFTSLSPGDYYLAAWANLEPGLEKSTEFLARFKAGTATVTIMESGEAKVDAKLIPVERIAAEIAKLP